MAEKGDEELPPEVQEESQGGEPDTQPSEQTTSTKSAKKGKKKRKADKSREPATGASAPAGSGNALNSRTLQELMGRLNLEEDKPKSHDFWDTQPVPKLDESVTELGPVEGNREDIRPEPLKLPDKFVWSDIDLTNDGQISELYTLLYENYVEDDDNLFRFDYSRDFLRWALSPPGYKGVWHCGVRVSTSGKLVGFISAVPAMIRIQSHRQQMVEINFLCVHKKLRSKRVAPVLIKEITRRVNLEGIFQAVYTAGILIPKPISACRYWHRSINPKKLVEVQFSSLHRNMTLQRMIRLYRLPDDTATPGLRPYKTTDAPTVLTLLNQQLSKQDLVPIFHSEAEVNYWFTPRPNIIDTYVVENPETKEVTDMISFYHLSSSIVRHPVHKTLFVAYLFYYAHAATPFKDLLNDMLIIAKKAGCDVFNALDIMDNKSVLEDLKFATGDGNLHYYFYNFKCPEIPSDKVGLVLQ